MLRSLFPIVAVLVLLPTGDALADAWTVQFDKSAMDDSESVYLTTNSVNTVPGSLNIEQVRPTLWIRCYEHKTSLFVNWSRYISTAGIDGDQPIRYRIDDNPPKKTSWSISSNFEATGLWSGGSSIPLIRQLIKAKRFLIEVTPYGSSTIQAEFNIAGLDKHIEAVQKACGWSATASASSGGSKKTKKTTEGEAVKPGSEPPTGTSSDATTSGSTTSSTDLSYALPGATPDEQYQYAFDLVRQTKYADAERALSMFVDEHPEHPLAGNASYWLGETYYVRKDYNNAALTFAQAFQKYPTAGKAPDSLLKLGMSLAALGETADACRALKELFRRYPNAPESVRQRAIEESANNGCQ